MTQNKLDLTRRSFLIKTAVAGSATLLYPRTGSCVPSNSTATADLVHSSAEKVPWKAQPFPMTQVRLLPSVWKDMMELNRGFLYSIPNDRLAYNFRKTAGIATDATPLGGWEAPDCELRGHYVGHYLSACALLSAGTDDEELRGKATALVSILAETQAKDGYLGAYPADFYERLRKHEKVWAPFYTYHKILAGLIDIYEHTGNQQALSMATRMADWADRYSATFTAEEWQRVLLVEHGGMMESAFNLYAISGKTKYRDLGYRFEHKKIFEPLAVGEDKLDGNHANTNIPKIIGASRGYELTGDDRFNRISRNFYRILVEHHTYCTGATSNGEFWHRPDAVSTELGAAAQECCCSYNMMKLSRHLFGQEPDAEHFDYYERLLVNARLGTQDRNGMLMYYLPLEPGMYKTFGTQYDAFWCCTGTGSEEYAKLNDSIYFHDDNSVFVNLYIPSKLDWAERGFSLEQTSKFPYDGRIALRITSAPSKPVALKLRIPYWATSSVSLRINGAASTSPLTPTSYVTVERIWKTGDVVDLHLPMTPHVSAAPDDPQVQAAMYGPMVLAAVLGREGLSTSDIYGGSGPDSNQHGMPMPMVRGSGTWFEAAESTYEYPLRFRSAGVHTHTLVPLNAIMDERYSVYLRNDS